MPAGSEIEKFWEVAEGIRSTGNPVDDWRRTKDVTLIIIDLSAVLVHMLIVLTSPAKILYRIACFLYFKTAFCCLCSRQDSPDSFGHRAIPFVGCLENTAQAK